MSNHPLIVFDSGLGGLSILKELLAVNVPLLYFADTLNFPYGDKSESWLQRRLKVLAKRFASYDPIGVVIACNTGTVSGINLLRTQLTCPVFGVEPVVKMLSHHSSPVVWATKVTLNSATANKLRLAHGGSHLRYYTPTNLPAAIEAQDITQVHQILKKAKAELGKIDAIGLSCTHYPLVKDEIQKVFPGVNLYDPSFAVANHVIKSLDLINHKSLILNHNIKYLATKDVLRLKRIAHTYLYDNSSIFS